MEILDEYKWLRVIRKKEWKNPLSNASYNKRRKTITIYDNFFTHDDFTQMTIFEHEYAHHIYYKMPLVYRKLWWYISNWRLIKVLNILGLTKYKENAYVTNYAKKNVREDFAESVEAFYVLEKKKMKIFSFWQFKVDIAKSMYDYFSNK